MKISYRQLIALMVAFCGCFLSGCFLFESAESNNDKTGKSPATNEATGETNRSRDPDGFLPLFDAEYTQNVSSNRMEKNLGRLSNSPPDGTPHHFQSAGLHVNIPPGMDLAERFTGFMGPSSDQSGAATMLILTNPFSMKKTTSGLISDAIRSGKTKIVFNKSLTICDQDAEFYLTVKPGGTDENRIEIVNYILVFGNDEFCWIVTCSFNKLHEAEFGENLLRSLLNVRISDEPRAPAGQDVNYTITPNRFKLTDGFVDKLVFTLTGVFPIDDSKSPVFQILRSIAEFKIEDEQTVARQLITPSPLFTVDLISSEKKVTIDGLSGHEFVSVGTDRLTEEPLFIYSLILFDGGDTYVMHGWSSSDNDENYVNDFRELANSFKRKK